MSLIVNSENKSNSRTKPISTTLIKDSTARDAAFYAPVGNYQKSLQRRNKWLAESSLWRT